MIRFSVIIMHLMLFMTACKEQAPAIKEEQKKTTGKLFKDFAYDGDKIWGLTTGGTLVLIDTQTCEMKDVQLKTGSDILAIANDNEGNIVVYDKKKVIRKYNKHTQSWATILKIEDSVLAITFDNGNNCYFITNKGLFEVSGQKYYYPEITQNDQITYVNGWFRDPAVLTDRHDNIWIGFGYGEWGGELFIFNTHTRKFISPDLTGFPVTLNPVKSIFEGDENVFVTSGLMHFSTGGSVVKFDRFKATIIFESEDQKKFPDDKTKDEIIHGEYIGPGVYSQKEKCIYFYSQNGIFKGNPQNDLSKIEKWTKVMKPEFHWTDGQPDAVGSPMNVLKLKFIDSDKLVILTQNDGIGIYNGKNLVMTR